MSNNETPLGVELPQITSVPSSALGDIYALVYFAKQYGLACAKAGRAPLLDQLGQCFRLSGSDPDGNENWRLAPRAGEAVRQLRADYDEACDENHKLLARIAGLEKRVKDLDSGKSQLIGERDHAEEIIDKLCDAVLGVDRSEWSSEYFFSDAVEEVEEEITRLRAHVDAKDARIAELERQLEAKVADAERWRKKSGAFRNRLVSAIADSVTGEYELRVATAEAAVNEFEDAFDAAIAARSPHPTAGADQQKAGSE